MKERKNARDQHLVNITGDNSMPRKIPVEGDSSDIVTGDWHIQFQDGRIISSFLTDLKDNDYDHIILNGDILDCYELSRFDKPPAILVNNLFEEEVKTLRYYVGKIRDEQPNAEIIYLPGNHENRWYKSINSLSTGSFFAFAKLGIDLPEEMKNPNLGDMMGLDDFEINFYTDSNPERTVYRLRDKLNVTHGWRAMKWSCATPKGYHMDYGGNWLIGHTHRMGVFYHTLASGETNISLEGGCMCKDLDYDPTGNWQRGYVRLHWAGSKFRPEMVTWT